MTQLLRFLVVGVLNTAVGLACIYAAMQVFNYRLANALGYTVGCGIGFLLNRSWTFRHEGAWWGSLARWLGVVAAAYSLNLLTVVALHEGLGVNAYVAQLGGVFVYTASSFLGGRHFVFRATQREAVT
jgi:putative flippase GtrA